MAKTALITGISGQDGSYLAELLLKKQYRVIGLSRNQNSASFQHPAMDIVPTNFTNTNELYSIIESIKPDEIYNLAAQSYPGISWENAIETMNVNGLAAHSLFDIVRQVKPDCRIYQASSSEMFGSTTEVPQNEKTSFNPVNPYAVTKLYAHHIANIYRKSYGMFICCGILFNHESERRCLRFVSQKITYAAACFKLGIQHSSALNEKGEPIVRNGKLLLGNLDVKRDWGFAGDYVEAMWLMLQHAESDDYVIGTGQMRTIRQLCETAFSYVNLDWEKYVQVDARFMRPVDTGPTVADPSKAKKILGWEAKVSFDELIARMVDAHLKILSANQNNPVAYST